MSIEWNNSTIAELRRLWDEGHSTAEIARRLGTTKNSCVGKSHRLGLPARPSPIKRDGCPNPPPIRRILPQRTIPLLPSEAQPAFAGEWITPERLAVLTRDWPTQKLRLHILEDMAALPGSPMPGGNTVSSYARQTLKVHRPDGFRAIAASRQRPAAPTPRSVSTLHQQIGAHARASTGQRTGVRDEPVPIERVRVAPAAKLFGRVTDCCWPTNDGPQWTFCEVPSEPGCSYCLLHAGLAYVSVRPRRERDYAG